MKDLWHGTKPWFNTYSAVRAAVQEASDRLRQCSCETDPWVSDPGCWYYRPEDERERAEAQLVSELMEAGGE